MFKKTVFLLAFIIALLSHSAAARDWSSYTSENFTLYSDIRPKRAIKMVEEFEIFRQLAFVSIGMHPKPSHAKMKILVYNKGREYRDIGPKNTMGFFTNTSAGPRMVVGPDDRAVSKNEILYHEYIHYLMREHSNSIYPNWYDEGLAEVLAATTIKRGKATIGAVPKGRSLSIMHERPFKVRDLLKPKDADDSRSYQSRFYAYAWLLTHYLQISSLNENKHLKQQTQEYLLRYNQGEESVKAFEDSFGITPEDMDKQLTKYLNQRNWTILEVGINDFTGEVTQQALTPGEQNFLLADIAWRAGEEQVALDYLEDIDLNSKDFARSLSLAAVLNNHKEEEESIKLSKTYAQRALALAPKNSQVLTNYAHWLADTRTRIEKGKTEIETAQLIDQQIDLTQQAIAIDPSNLEALSFLWQGQLDKGEDLEALRTMMTAYQAEPASASVNHTVANHLLALQRADLARPFLQRIMNWSHSAEQRLEIQQLLDEIDEHEAQASEKQ